MSKQPPAAQPVIAVSPYLSLRQAVRPLIFAYALLAREQERAGELFEECRSLIQLTQELLEAAALVHLLAPAKDEKVGGSLGDSRRSQLVAAYAKAGLMWAEVTGRALALGDALLDSNKWHDVYRLADFLDAAGEQPAAQDLRNRAQTAAKRANEGRLGQIHPTMTEPEIAAAIEVMRESKDETAVSFYINALESAILSAPSPSWQRRTFDCLYQGKFKFKWLVKAGDRVENGAAICMYNQWVSDRWDGYRPGYDLNIEFPAIIAELLVAEDSSVKLSPDAPKPLASVIEIPKDIASVLEAAQRGKIFDRVGVLDRIFRQIQTEKRLFVGGT